MSPINRRDTLLIAFAKGSRAFGYGLLGVALGLHLPTIGLTPAQVGVVLTAVLLGSALLTAVFVALADRLGRRRVLVISAGLMVVSGALFGLVEQFEFLVLLGLLGTVSPTSGEVGPFETLEQAILPQIVTADRRNRVFGSFNSLAAVMTALGALSIAAPSWLGGSAQDGFFWAFGVYAGFGIAGLISYSLLSPAVELHRATAPTPRVHAGH